ncbi:hypothetical protein [Rhodococcus aetherivorans]|uniref:hypothetical protein n=1 Tax=Rhodococcus aetherivorans TaxID=191292 RepID=UPI00388EEBC4
MRDAEFTWAEEVNNSEKEADSLHADISDLTREIERLSSDINSLQTRIFADGAEDYEILVAARELWSSVTSSVQEIRGHIRDAIASTHDAQTVMGLHRGERG